MSQPAPSSIPEETNITITDVPIDKLHVNENNPRTITKEAFARLKKSLAEDPEMMKARPIIALPDGTVIGGNMRYRAAQALGWRTVPCVYADLEETRAKQWIVRDNASYGEWDDQGLAELLYEIQQAGADLDLAGLDNAEVERLLDTVTGEEHADTDPDDVGRPRLHGQWICHGLRPSWICHCTTAEHGSVRSDDKKSRRDLSPKGEKPRRLTVQWTSRHSRTVLCLVFQRRSRLKSFNKTPELDGS
jgi:hypothetical protein